MAEWVKGRTVHDFQVDGDGTAGARIQGVGRGIRTWAWPLALVTLVVAAYVRTVNFGLRYDDYVLARDWSAADLASTFHGRFDPTAINDAYFRPLVSTSFALDWAIWNTDSVGYHISNMLLHVAVVLSLYALLRRLSAPNWAAAVGASVFALVPSNAAALLYISERSDSLATFFVVLGLLATVRYRRNPRLMNLLGVNVCLVAALLAKEIGIVLLLLAPTLWIHLGVDGEPDRSQSLLGHWRSEVRRFYLAGIDPALRAPLLQLIGTLSTVCVSYLVYRGIVLPPGSFVSRFSEGYTPPLALVKGVYSTIQGVPWEVQNVREIAVVLPVVAAFAIRPRSTHWRLGCFGLVALVAGVAPLTFNGGVEPRLLYCAQIGVAILITSTACVFDEAIRSERATWTRRSLRVGALTAAVMLTVTTSVGLRDSQDVFLPDSPWSLESHLRLWNQPDQVESMPAEYVKTVRALLLENGLITSDGSPDPD